jgi:hypothetical protein
MILPTMSSLNVICERRWLKTYSLVFPTTNFRLANWKVLCDASGTTLTLRRQAGAPAQTVPCLWPTCSHPLISPSSSFSAPTLSLSRARVVLIFMPPHRRFLPLDEVPRAIAAVDLAETRERRFLHHAPISAPCRRPLQGGCGGGRSTPLRASVGRPHSLVEIEAFAPVCNPHLHRFYNRCKAFGTKGSSFSTGCAANRC